SYRHSQRPTYNVQLTTFNWTAGLPTEWRCPRRPFESSLDAALNGAPITWAVGPGWYEAGPSALDLLMHEHQRSGTQSGAFMPETTNYAAVYNAVVLVGHRSAKGAVHTSVG
ncbi:MAG TPA: hypothetical protein PLW35_13720, partial [Verrucomicrobiota bacterium]|nr:hypothetical protein [Verrucomicrobiota bacterium]